MATPTIKTTESKVDKVLSQLNDFNLRIGDLFRVASTPPAPIGPDNAPVGTAVPISKQPWFWPAVGGLGLFVFVVLRRK
jgi:hypothetical protein